MATSSRLDLSHFFIALSTRTWSQSRRDSDIKTEVIATSESLANGKNVSFYLFSVNNVYDSRMSSASSGAI